MIARSVLENVINIILTVVITGALGYMATLVKMEQKSRNDVKKDNQKQDRALSALLHDRLYQACKFYILSNQIELEELNNLRHMFEPYEDLGGNGVCKRMYERCLELPIVESRAAERGEKNED